MRTKVILALSAASLVGVLGWYLCTCTGLFRVPNWWSHEITNRSTALQGLQSAIIEYSKLHPDELPNTVEELIDATPWLTGGGDESSPKWARAELERAVLFKDLSLSSGKVQKWLIAILLPHDCLLKEDYICAVGDPYIQSVWKVNEAKEQLGPTVVEAVYAKARRND